VENFRSIQEIRLDYGIRITTKTRDLLVSAIPPHWSDYLSLYPYGPLPLIDITADSLVTEIGGEAVNLLTLSCHDARIRLTSKILLVKLSGTQNGIYQSLGREYGNMCLLFQIPK